MDELYLSKKQLDELYRRIPKYEKDYGIKTEEENEYNTYLEKFVTLGRKVLGSDSIGVEDIKKALANHAVQKVKSFLQKENEDMFSSLSQLDDISKDSLERLEYCVFQSEKDRLSFERDEDFAEEREFLKQFTDEDIESFKRFSDFLRDSYSKENTISI